jgi:hypothetical protein
VREVSAASAVLLAKRGVAVPLPDRLIDWVRYPFQRRAFESLMRERFRGFPWLAGAWADYVELQFARESAHLAMKRWPAPSAAARVRELGQEAGAAERRARSAEYVLAYYETLFPFLVEFREEQAEDQPLDDATSFAEELLGDLEGDPARRWLTDAEYRKLPDAKKYQLALDRYWSKQKTRWEIGRDYERYIGYKYEADGFAVQYQGIIEGFADFGRDLIATKAGTAEVVQCKYWSQHRTIHEKHVFQLLGTALAYKIEHPAISVSATFVTSTQLSERAREFAAQIEAIMPFTVRESERLDMYPCIKCNVSRKNGEKIYHLPFDQQYDAVLIEGERRECHATTIAEAEQLGFRRAKRWLGLRGGA